MWAIKRTNGICLVQDPAEAEFADMPQNVLNDIGSARRARLREMPALIKQLLINPLPPELPVPEELQMEASLTEQMMSDINSLKKIPKRSDFNCPDWSGGMWAVKNDPVHRYRCHTGHVYTERRLADQQGESREASIWVSIRMLEERHNLLLTMAGHAKDGGDQPLVTIQQQRAAAMNRHIKRLKEVLLQLAHQSGV